MKADRIKAAFEQGRRDAQERNGIQARYSDAERDEAYQRGYLLTVYSLEIKQRRQGVTANPQGKRK